MVKTGERATSARPRVVGAVALPPPPPPAEAAAAAAVVADRVRDAADDIVVVLVLVVVVGSGVNNTPCKSLLRKGSFAGPVMDAWS